MKAAKRACGRKATAGVLLAGLASACADGTPPHFAEGAELALRAEDGRLAASWPAAEDDREVAAYLVTVNGTPVARQSGTEYAVGEAAELASFRVSVTAVDAAGNESAPLAAEATMPDRTPPSFSELAHIDLTATGRPGEPARTLTVAWTAATDNAAVTGYEVRAEDALLGTTEATQLEVPGVALGSDYAVTVVALDAADLRSAPLTARWADSRQAANEAARLGVEEWLTAHGHPDLGALGGPANPDLLLGEVPSMSDVLEEAAGVAPWRPSTDDVPGPAAPADANAAGVLRDRGTPGTIGGLDLR
jgi:chitodextrinase